MALVPGQPAMLPPTGQVEEMLATPHEARKMSTSGEHPGIEQRLYGFRARLDPNVTLEEYSYWAGVERQMETEEFKRYKGNDTILGTLASSIMPKKERHMSVAGPSDEKAIQDQLARSKEHGSESDDAKPIPPSTTHELDAEWRTAVRAMRTASWGGVFYLITSDILVSSSRPKASPILQCLIEPEPAKATSSRTGLLRLTRAYQRYLLTFYLLLLQGWSQTPYVFANTGYGLGVGMFVLMGLAAAASGWMIWRTFLTLDSSRFPVLSFGDHVFRLFGPKTRHFINVAQALQMFLSVAVLQLGQTNVLAQLAANTSLCYVVAGVIILVVGMASGYLRSLKHLSWLSNFCIWLNVICFIIVCVAAARFGPSPVAQVNSGILPKAWATNPVPVRTFGGTPPVEYQPTDANLFAAQFNGINSIVYAYSGAILFVAFLAEMRHPLDFWKAVFLAQLFIACVYIFFGVFVSSLLESLQR